MKRSLAYTLLAVVAIAVLSAPSFAIQTTSNINALQLANALTAGSTGITVTGASLVGFGGAGGPASSGTYTNASGTYLIPAGIVLSSGSVLDYSDGPNTSGSFTTNWGGVATPAQDALLSPLTVPYTDHYDVTALTINFDMQPGYDTVYFNVAFGSEEYPEWVGTHFNDAFGLFLNGTNIAFVGGLPVNIDHPCMTPLPGTELDGVLACNGLPVNLFSGLVNPIGNELLLIVADTGDQVLDTTVYISGLGGTPPPPIPEPASLILFGSGLSGLGYWVRKFRK